MKTSCVFFRSVRLVPAARACIVLQALGCPVALCVDCEQASLRLPRQPPWKGHTNWLWIALAALLVACGGEASAPAPAGCALPPPCNAVPWSTDLCAAIDREPHALFCPDRAPGTLNAQGVWSGAPENACRPSDGTNPDPDVWCCW
jgi:hypothetical protein